VKQIIAFIRRYWIFIVGFFFFLWVSRTEIAFDWVGTIVHLPAYGLGAILAALLFRRIFFPATLDDDARSGYFVEAWKQLTAAQRVYCNLAVVIGLFWGMCYVAGSMMR
jgi:hypothetical protein